MESLDLRWVNGGPLHFHRFIKRAPACAEKRSWKSEALRWKVAVDSEQETLQYDTSTNSQQHGKHQYKALT